MDQHDDVYVFHVLCMIRATFVRASCMLVSVFAGILYVLSPWLVVVTHRGISEALAVAATDAPHAGTPRHAPSVVHENHVFPHRPALHARKSGERNAGLGE